MKPFLEGAPVTGLWSWCTLGARLTKGRRGLLEGSTGALQMDRDTLRGPVSAMKTSVLAVISCWVDGDTSAEVNGC